MYDALDARLRTRTGRLDALVSLVVKYAELQWQWWRNVVGGIERGQQSGWETVSSRAGDV